MKNRRYIHLSISDPFSFLYLFRSMGLATLVLFILTAAHGLTRASIKLYGGGWFYDLSGYPLDEVLVIAGRVFLEYYLVGCVAAFLLCYLRFPLKWYVVGLLSSYITLTRWKAALFYPYPGPGFFLMTIHLSYLIIPETLLCSLLGKAISKRYLAGRRFRNANRDGRDGAPSRPRDLVGPFINMKTYSFQSVYRCGSWIVKKRIFHRPLR